MIPLDDDIWSVPLPFSLAGCRLGTKTTIIRSNGKLLLISPGPFSEENIEAINQLGRVTTLLAPNKMHHLYLTHALEHFPDARVLMAPGLSEKRPELVCHGVLPQPLDEWNLEQQFVRGLPDLNETALFHTPSRTLVLTDLAFHFPRHSHLPTRLFLRLNGALGRFGPTRVLKYLFLKDRASFTEDLGKVMQWPVEKIVVGHGEDVLEDGLAQLEAGFQFGATSREPRRHPVC